MTKYSVGDKVTNGYLIFNILGIFEQETQGDPEIYYWVVADTVGPYRQMRTFARQREYAAGGPLTFTEDALQPAS